MVEAGEVQEGVETGSGRGTRGLGKAEEPNARLRKQESTQK